MAGQDPPYKWHPTVTRSKPQILVHAQQATLAADSADSCSRPKDDKTTHAVMTFRKVDTLA